VRDGGIPGVTVRLGRGLASIAVRHGEVRVGAGALARIVAFAAAAAGLGGLEFLSGIPGTIGGSLRMNAGAYGCEVRDVLVSATALDGAGRRHTIDCDGMQLSYRHCGVDPCWIFIETRLRGAARNRDVIARRLAEIRALREATQPVRARTGGSTFTNPAGEAAWRLIDAAGCRGLVRGGAMVSPKHANFLINTGNATAADLEGLGEEVRRRVYETRGILLEWEICRIGIPVPGMEPIVEHDQDLSHTAPSAAPTPPSAGSGTTVRGNSCCARPDVFQSSTQLHLHLPVAGLVPATHVPPSAPPTGKKAWMPTDRVRGLKAHGPSPAKGQSKMQSSLYLDKACPRRFAVASAGGRP
jgi:UDP-N-acetylmuramate dehydrogenase